MALLIVSLIAIAAGALISLPLPGCGASPRKDGPRNPPKGPACIPACITDK